MWDGIMEAVAIVISLLLTTLVVLGICAVVFVALTSFSIGLSVC